MAHLSLYRKHRPRTFAEVVGQEHVTRTLVNAITEGTLHHAYLFTGQRGTGKTSTARILAAAVNCEQGPTPEPCGTCDQCVSIVQGSNVDVVELDMASHGGVDDARELRDRAVFAPAAARRKVYILDEVHMASTAAFNALLKVIEEPPSHVLFTMATTDPQKVLPTIMSRVQRLDLRRVSAADLTAHLRHLGEVEGFTLDAAAAAGVVAAGDGSVRDTLSVLEQVLAFAADAEARVDGVLPVTGEHVTTVLGATPFDRVSGVADAIADADVAAALTRIQELLDEGHDLRRFTLDLARHLRDLLVTAAAPGVEGLVDATAERRTALVGQAQRFGTDTLVRAVELVGEVLVEQRQGPPRLPLELAVARLATPGADGDLAALADRVARLETAYAGGSGGVPAPAAPATPSTTPAPAARATAPPDGAATAPPDRATPADGPAARGGTDAGTAATDDVAVGVGSAGAAGADDASPVVEELADAAATSTDAGAADAATSAGTEGDATAPDAPRADVAEEATVDDAGAQDAAAGDAGPDDPGADDPGADDPGADDAGPDDPGTDHERPGDDDVADDEDAAPSREAASGEELAARAQALADSAGELSPASPLEDRPGTTAVAREATAPTPSGGDDLALIVERWEAILELVAEASRRAKAFYEPATPIRLGNGVLLLSYPSTRRFHAEQGKGGEMVGHLATAIERSTGLAGVRVDVRLEDDGPSRPAPPPVAGGSDDEGVSPDEEAAVAEAAATPAAGPVDAATVDQLVRDTLGAQPLPDDE